MRGRVSSYTSLTVDNQETAQRFHLLKTSNICGGTHHEPGTMLDTQNIRRIRYNPSFQEVYIPVDRRKQKNVKTT